MDPLAARLSRASPVNVVGTWQRHVPARFAGTGLQGRSAVGRWGTAGGDPVLYLGKPTDSVVVEAYRHLIDPVVAIGGAVPPVRPRVLIMCEVSVTNILDLRAAATRALSGLTLKQLQSDTYDKAAYAACQNVAAAAQELEFHGLVAPAATKLGETLVLFTDLLPLAEHPVRTADELWVKLPPDPRSS
jgi:hypothetical protein